MTETITLVTDLLWQNGLAVLPLVLLVGLVTRFTPCRPATKHLLWGMVLVWLVVPPLVPGVDLNTPLAEAVTGDVVVPDVADASLPPDNTVRNLADRVAALSNELRMVAEGSVGAEVLADADQNLFQSLVRPVERTPKTLARASVPDGRWPSAASSIPPVDSNGGAVTNDPPSDPAAWRVWLVSIAAVRDAVGRIPAMPPGIWWGGVAALGLIGLCRLASFALRVRVGAPADRAVRRVVRRAAKRMHLRRVPVVLMVEDRVSPMVSGGFWPRLILPRPLWVELDDAGREAVVCHELAHLRRCDHLVVWADTFVGMLYWWHPVIWWVRSRLHAEAENCCDAWVTTLRPAERRVYAQTLLRTREYLSGESRVLPAMTVGMTSGRAKRFARRLTMVMTNRVKPGLSAPGVVLALAVAVMGWLASPARSCPNEKDRHGLIEGQTAHEVHLAADESKDADVAEVRLVGDRRDDDRDGDIEERMERLERQLDDLMRAFEHNADHGRRGPRGHRPRGLRDRGEHAERGHDERGPDGRPDYEGRPRFAGPDGRMGPPPDAGYAPRPPRPPHAPRGPRPPHGPRAYRPEAGHMSWRSYELSGEKLEAFTALMVLDEVPILVRPGRDSIEIQATHRQHELFEAFLGMIGGADAHARFAPVSPVRPRSGRPHGGHARVSHGTPGCQHCATGRGKCANCKKHSKRHRKSANVRRTAKKALRAARRELAKVRAELGGKVAELREETRAEVRQARRQVRSLEAYVDELFEGTAVSQATPTSETVEITGAAPEDSTDEVEITVVIDTDDATKAAQRTAGDKKSHVAAIVAKGLNASSVVVKKDTERKTEPIEAHDHD